MAQGGAFVVAVQFGSKEDAAHGISTSITPAAYFDAMVRENVISTLEINRNCILPSVYL